MFNTYSGIFTVPIRQKYFDDKPSNNSAFCITLENQFNNIQRINVSVINELYNII